MFAEARIVEENRQLCKTEKKNISKEIEDQSAKLITTISETIRGLLHDPISLVQDNNGLVYTTKK
ncbi:hypothetical protein G9A89_010953 [Geosiphon pyriformis]|nr:hypothetical protein G9A89_010953 [Geosiphon pyriformis]